MFSSSRSITRPLVLTNTYDVIFHCPPTFANEATITTHCDMVLRSSIQGVTTFSLPAILLRAANSEIFEVALFFQHKRCCKHPVQLTGDRNDRGVQRDIQIVCCQSFPGFQQDARLGVLCFLKEPVSYPYLNDKQLHVVRKYARRKKENEWRRPHLFLQMKGYCIPAQMWSPLLGSCHRPTSLVINI